MAQDLLTVGQFAAAAGVTVSTLHYWERAGLLLPAQRSPAGYRLYDPAQVAEARRIRELQALGFLRGQVAALRTAVASAASQTEKRDQVRGLYEQHLAAVHRKVQQYGEIEQRLRAVTPDGLFELMIAGAHLRPD